MKSILFLAPDDLGETILATGVLAHLLSDGDVLTAAVSQEARPLLRAAPGEHIWLRPRHAWRVALSCLLAARRYDVLIDARLALSGRLFRAARRIALTPGAILRHRAEDWAAAAGADHALAPQLWLDHAARTAALDVAPGAALLVLAPGGASAAKRWPQDRFAAVARRLATGSLANARVVVLGAAERDAAIASAIVSSLDADGVEAVNLGQGLDLLAAAALMERATLCIGNDNALTHIAAAMGAPTLTLFGPTDERVRAPYGPRARALRGRSLEAAAGLSQSDMHFAMKDIGIDTAESAALELLHAGGLR